MDRCKGVKTHRLLRVGADARHPEIAQHRAAIIGDQKISWLDVTMSNFGIMRRSDCAGDGYPYSDGFQHGQLVAAMYPVRQRSPWEVLHRDERPVIGGGACVVNGDDLWEVRQASGCLALAGEPAQCVRVPEVGAQNLHGHRSRETFLVGGVHGAEPAGRDPLKIPVTLDGRTR